MMGDAGLRPLPEYEPPARPMPLPKGVLPAGTDVDEIVRNRASSAAYDVWHTYQALRVSREQVASRPPEDPVRKAAEDLIAQAVPVTARQALAANRRVVDELLRGRLEVVAELSADGARWDEVVAPVPDTAEGGRP